MFAIAVLCWLLSQDFVARVVGLGIGAGCVDLPGLLAGVVGLSIELLLLGVRRLGRLG